MLLFSYILNICIFLFLLHAPCYVLNLKNEIQIKCAKIKKSGILKAKKHGKSHYKCTTASHWKPINSLSTQQYCSTMYERFIEFMLCNK